MGHLACVELLLESRADPNLLCSKMGPAPLHLACQERRPDIVERLLCAKADASLVLLGRTALQVARERGSSACVQLLEAALSDAPTAAAAADATPTPEPVETQTRCLCGAHCSCASRHSAVALRVPRGRI